MTNNTNYKFNDILDGITAGELNLEEAILDLSKINNSYARNIVHMLEAGALEEAMRLLKQSCAFENQINAVETNAIILTDDEIIARRDNLILINGMTKKEATLLAYRRAGRLANDTVVRHTSIESGTFLI